MERIFYLSTDAFLSRMEEISQEAWEAYKEYLVIDRIPKDICICRKLLKIVYVYVKTGEKKYWRSSTLIHLLHEIAVNGDLLYMETEETQRESCEIGIEVLKDMQMVRNMAVLAGLVIRYYYHVFERDNQSEEYEDKIDESINELMSVEASVIDRRRRKKEEEVPLPIQIKEHLDLEVQGQEEAKKIISMASARFARYGERFVILLSGSTGVGKTFLFDNLSRCDCLSGEMAFYSYTATQLTPNGFSGDNVENILKQYRKVCEQWRYADNDSAAQDSNKGIIFIDEIDKLFIPNNDSSGDDVNQTVLHQLLTVIAGTANISNIDTGNISFILAGAFEDVESSIKEMKRKANLGFSVPNKVIENDLENYDLRYELLKRGAPRQFVARITHFVRLEEINRDIMRNILINPQNGLFTHLVELFQRDGLTIRFESEEVIETLIDRIMETKMGVRGVKEMLMNMVRFYDYDMIEKGYQVMIIHNDVFEGKPPIFEKKKEVWDENTVRHYK